MAATSKVVSATLTATYFAAEPKPGQVSVLANRCQWFLGMPTTVSGQSKNFAAWEIFNAVSAESLPPL